MAKTVSCPPKFSLPFFPNNPVQLGTWPPSRVFPRRPCGSVQSRDDAQGRGVNQMLCCVHPSPQTSPVPYLDLHLFSLLLGWIWTGPKLSFDRTGEAAVRGGGGATPGSRAQVTSGLSPEREMSSSVYSHCTRSGCVTQLSLYPNQPTCGRQTFLDPSLQ